MVLMLRSLALAAACHPIAAMAAAVLVFAVLLGVAVLHVLQVGLVKLLETGKLAGDIL